MANWSSFSRSGDLSENIQPLRALLRRGFGRWHEAIPQIRRGQQKRDGESRGRRVHVRRGQFPVRSPVKIAPNWSEAKRTNERTIQVHKPPGGFLEAVSHVGSWPMSEFVDATVVCMYSGRATTVGSSRWPWGEANSLPAMLPRDAMTNRSGKKRAAEDAKTSEEKSPFKCHRAKSNHSKNCAGSILTLQKWILTY